MYEALDQRLNCIVALKETSAGSDNETRLAFEREAALLANLRHSALPKVMDYFSEGDGDFLAMEFIPGHQRVVYSVGRRIQNQPKRVIVG